MSRGRSRLVKFLVVLGSIFAFLSVFGIWIERQALNTDDWVHTSDKLIANATIREAVADYLVNTLYENVDVEEELEEILPGETKQLAGPVSGAVRSVAGDRGQQGAGDREGAGAVAGGEPDRARRTDRRPQRRTGKCLDRGRRSDAGPQDPGHQPRERSRDRRNRWPKNCPKTPARS